MIRRLLRIALLPSLVCPGAWADDPVGAEFQVNTFTTGVQEGATAAQAANGSFVVAWTSGRGNANQDGSYTGVFGQRFDASGAPQGSEFQVNSYTTGDQRGAAVAADASGNFVVVWSSGKLWGTVVSGQDGSSAGVFGQRFDASGVPQGGEFQVNSYTTGAQASPRVACGANGDFVVVWSSAGQDGSIDGVFGQRFDASGVPQGGEFQVNSHTPYSQRLGDVASDARGNFVVVWTSELQDGSSQGVFGRRYNALGIPQGSEFQVNSYTTGNQAGPAVASNAKGDFVVVWRSRHQDGSGSGIFGQRFDAVALPRGSEFQVNSYTTGEQGVASVGADATGNFVVVWDSDGQDGSGYGIFGQHFNALGAPLGSEFHVNSYTSGAQRFPRVASGASGGSVAVWSSYGQDGSENGVFGQRYGDIVFRDGFEGSARGPWAEPPSGRLN